MIREIFSSLRVSIDFNILKIHTNKIEANKIIQRKHSNGKGEKLSTEFLEEKKDEIYSRLGKGNKSKLELGIGLAFFIILVLFWQHSAWRVEWTWRVSQVAIPLILSLSLRRSLKNDPLSLESLKNNIKIGLLTGILLSIILAYPLLVWTSPLMPKNLNSFAEIFYSTLLILTNIIPIEYFFRGFLQPRLELFTGVIPGMIIVSILSGFDFWEYQVFNIPLLMGIGIIFSLLYLRTRSILATSLAHFSFFMITMSLTLI